MRKTTNFIGRTPKAPPRKEWPRDHKQKEEGRRVTPSFFKIASEPVFQKLSSGKF